jgi:hypothetical protein
MRIDGKTEEEEIYDIFHHMLDETGDKISAALLVLSATLKIFLERNLDHTLSMALRKGLGGQKARDNETLRDFIAKKKDR